METVRRLYLRSWRGVAIAVSLAIIAYLLYFQRLGSLLPGYSTPELNAYAAARNWHAIMSNPVNVPYTFFVWVLTALAHRSILMTRVVAACFGLAAGLLFFGVVRAWCTYRAAYLGTILFVTSAGLLHFARLGTADILQMSILTLLGFVLWYRYRRQHRRLIGYCIAVFFVILLYVPGMIWFELLGLAMLSGTVRRQLRRMRTTHLAAMLAVFVVLLAPLAVASIRKPSLLLQVAGLPNSFSVLLHTGGRLWDNVLGVLVHGSGSPLIRVGHAPMLTIVEVIVGALGAFYLYREAPRRGLFLFGWIVVGLLLASVGGAVTMACIVPALYLLIATGIDRLLGEWLTVFPRNPVARLAGVGLVCIMLTFSVIYQLRAYYVAWPHDPATRQLFDHAAP